MLPILTAVSAIDTVDKLATGAMALWKQMSASRADAKKEADQPSGSFLDALKSHGSDVRSTTAGEIAAHVAQTSKSSHVLDHLT